MVGGGAPFHFFLALECQQGWGGNSQGSLVGITVWCFGAQHRQAASLCLSEELEGPSLTAKKEASCLEEDGRLNACLGSGGGGGEAESMSVTVRLWGPPLYQLPASSCPQALREGLGRDFSCLVEGLLDHSQPLGSGLSQAKLKAEFPLLLLPLS